MNKTESFDFLEELWKIILERSEKSSPKDSYVAYLLSQGPEDCAKKLGEESIETVIASLKDEKKEIVHESADLLFHLLVLWKAKGISPNVVMDELKSRKNISGFKEKQNR